MDARYTLVIGSKLFSSWSLRPWLALKMAGIPFDEIVIPLRTETTKAEIAAHSPSGKVPALKIEEDGRTHVVWDSFAICETLNERHADARLWPDDPWQRAQARSMAEEMHSGFPDLRQALSFDVGRKIALSDPGEAATVQIARIIAMWEWALARYGAKGGFLFGRFSIADCFYAPVVTRFDTYGIDMPPASRAYMEHILTLPAMQEWIAAAQREPRPRQD